MKHTSIIWLAFLLLFSHLSVVAQQTLSTPNPSKEAVALYKYLLDMKGKKILSGQMCAPFGIDELKYLQANTGKQPALRGIDFIDQKENAKEVQYAIEWWKGGGIPTIMWHWGAPSVGEGYENSKKAIDIDKCFEEGTAEYKSFWLELKNKADLLEKIRDANVPVLWRPYHELNGNWFWWGKQGPEKFKRLWITMYNYFVKERKLNNLIWVLCYTGQPDEKWYPGDQYVDIAGADTYKTGDGPQPDMYNKVKTITNDKFPIAYHECGIPPNPDQCLSQGIMWSWWMEWHTSWLQEVDKTYLKYVYNHDLVITLDEVPDIMAKYGSSAQAKNDFTPAQIKAIETSCDSISGPGKPVIGNGGGGWRSGSDGVQYSGAYPADPRWTLMDASKTTGSVIKAGLLPPIKPLLELHLRDTQICLGGDGNYYMTGSSGDNIWAYAAGLELWKSKDLKKWSYMGLVWSIAKEGTWEKKWQNLHGKPARALWAPEIHFVKNNYFICLSMPPGGIAILKSTTGKAEGPYVHAITVTDKPFVNGIDPTLFQDDDGKVYFTWSGATRIALMKDDMSGFAEPFHQIVLQNPDHDPTHHAARCEGRGMNDLGTEGAVLFKANGKYYLGAADDYQGRYSSCVAMSDNIYGPYTNRHETVPCGGGTGFFKDKKGNWWCSYFGNDSQSPWREKPGIVKIDFAADGKIVVSKKQPFVDDPKWN